jgi:D-lyxose ketol-isomerase
MITPPESREGTALSLASNGRPLDKNHGPSLEQVPRGEEGYPLARSLINECVSIAREVLVQLNIPLPRHASWSVDEWNRSGSETREIRDCMLGWDVTDFGSRNFHNHGRTLFTLRNGKTTDERYPKRYAEKLLIEPEGQRSPMHFHRSKREDIINRAGGNVIVVLFPLGEDGLPGRGIVEASIDGISHRVPAGEHIRLEPGESVSINPSTYHQFWAEENTGLFVNGTKYTVSSEVSSVCDDWNDNIFIEKWAKRFPPIVEDVSRSCYLCHEYPFIL